MAASSIDVDWPSLMPPDTDALPVEIDPFYVHDLRQMAVAHNYRRWQLELVAPHVSGCVLEIGGGIGNFTAGLAERAESVITLEPNEYCFRELVEATKHCSNVQAYNIAAEDLDARLDSGLRADSVVCMNVVEHIEDDEAALRLFTGRLRAGGRVVLLVPAVAWAFGDIDRRLGHFRRYSRRQARSLIRQAGLQPVTIQYFNFVGLWGWLWNTKVASINAQSDRQIKVFDRYIVPWQSRLEKLVRLPIGQSLLIVARKPFPAEAGSL
jgi:SAM-dependent methyltransferase